MSGADAADLVVVDYEPLPVVMDMEASASQRDPAVPRVGEQLSAATRPPPVDGLFDGADVIVEQSMISHAWRRRRWKVARAPRTGTATA